VPKNLTRDDIVDLNLVPESGTVELLRYLNEIGFNNPMLFGGSIRNFYQREKCGRNIRTNDYDIYATTLLSGN
jgi:hypothetical protein